MDGDDEGGVGGGGFKAPLFDGVFRGFGECGVTAENAGSLDNACGGNADFHFHDSADSPNAQNFGIVGLNAFDDLALFVLGQQRQGKKGDGEQAESGARGSGKWFGHVGFTRCATRMAWAGDKQSSELRGMP